MHRNNVHLLHPISYLEYIWCEFFGIFLVFGGVKRKINFHNKIFASTVDYLALESQLPHCFSNVVSIILTSSESAIVQLGCTTGSVPLCTSSSGYYFMLWKYGSRHALIPS